MTGILNLLAGSISSAIKDGYFNLVTLLLPGNGTNGAQNNTFVDSSTNNFTITRNGNTTQGTFSPFQNGWSNYFDGTGDYLSIADNVAFTMGTGDFTIEYWTYVPTLADMRSYGQCDSVPNVNTISFFGGINGSSKGYCGVRSGTTEYACTSTANFPTNQWVHHVLVRDGTTLRQYINGVQDGTSSVGSASVNDSSFQLSIGRLGEFNAYYWNGYISNFRIVKGTCLYPSGTTFTPPTAALTAVSGTSLLACQSNRFLDNSSNAFTITRNGDVSVQAFSPFAPTAAYSAATNGGSGYSDGTGDYLTVASNANLTLGSSDFTIELWWYPLAFNSDGEIFTMGSTGGTNRCYAMYSSGSNGTLAAFAGQGGSSWDIVSNLSMGTAIRNAWNHMAFTRSGSTFSTYLNGSRIATTTASGTLGSSGLGIFANNSGTSQAPSGYIGGARTIKGTALYTGTTYTVPTAPFTAVTNTNLLLNFTNAGITDATAKNDLETVGNAQISTTQSKFGGSSMYFDGTGDYLDTPQSDLYSMRTGNFTLEFWVYFSSTSGTQVIYTGRNTTTPYIQLNSGALQFGFSGGPDNVINYTWNPSATTWYHVAFVRSSGTLSLYINGTSVASASNSTDWATPAYARIAANNSGASAFNGYLDDFRLTKGYARYTSNFTAPTAAFPLQ